MFWQNDFVVDNKTKTKKVARHFGEGRSWFLPSFVRSVLQFISILLFCFIKVKRRTKKITCWIRGSARGGQRESGRDAERMRLWFVSRLVSRISVRRSGVRNGHAVAPSVGQRRVTAPKTRKRQLANFKSQFFLSRNSFSRSFACSFFCFRSIFPPCLI